MDTIKPRNWFFVSESAIYEREGFDDVIDSPQKPGDDTIKMWREEDNYLVYRYFWNWSLPPITFTSEYLSVRFAWVGNYGFPWYFPAIWLEEYKEWVELSWSGSQE